MCYLMARRCRSFTWSARFEDSVFETPARRMCNRVKSYSLALLLAAPSAPCAPSAMDAQVLQRFEFVEQHMGTLMRIVVEAPSAAAARSGREAAFARIAELERVFSDYDSTSEIRRLAAQPHGMPVPVSAELFELLVIAQRIARETNGAFDVTVGPASQLWRRSRRTRVLPSDTERDVARAAMGFRKLLLDREARTVTLLAPGMQLDFGGIAKGAAADAALEVLRQHGLPRALVAAGGDVAVGDGSWRIAGVDSAVANVGISTSGDASQFVEIDGVRYAHIIDPRTGLGVVGGREVTVVARTATESDALATAAFVMGRPPPPDVAIIQLWYRERKETRR